MSPLLRRRDHLVPQDAHNVVMGEQGDLLAAVAIEDAKEGRALIVEVEVDDMCVFHVDPPSCQEKRQGVGSGGRDEGR